MFRHRAFCVVLCGDDRWSSANLILRWCGVWHGRAMRAPTYVLNYRRYVGLYLRRVEVATPYEMSPDVGVGDGLARPALLHQRPADIVHHRPAYIRKRPALVWCIRSGRAMRAPTSALDYRRNVGLYIHGVSGSPRPTIRLSVPGRPQI